MPWITWDKYAGAKRKVNLVSRIPRNSKLAVLANQVWRVIFSPDSCWVLDIFREPPCYLQEMVLGQAIHGQRRPLIRAWRWSLGNNSLVVRVRKDRWNSRNLLFSKHWRSWIYSDDIKTMEISLISGYAKGEFHSNADSQEKYITGPWIPPADGSRWRPTAHRWFRDLWACPVLRIISAVG